MEDGGVTEDGGVGVLEDGGVDGFVAPLSFELLFPSVLVEALLPDETF